jgi:hypothetical protein
VELVPEKWREGERRKIREGRGGRVPGVHFAGVQNIIVMTLE